MIKTMPVWTLAIALMAVTASPSNAQSKTPVSSGSATNSIINESTLRQPNAIYGSFGQSSSALSQPTQAPLSNTTTAVTSTPINYDASENALQLARRNPNLSILVEAIDAAGLTGVLRFAGSNYTVFAPDNAAFEAWFNETTMTKQKLMQNKPLLRILLAYHVLKTPQPLTVAQMQPSRLTTFNNYQLTITNQKMIKDGIGRTAMIKAADIPTRNGTVHVIDKVLFPEG
ncbi:fasciclin domain-containing protein [Psychrobacter piechaudii]|uniref:Immunogenic protein MPT70 n=1 Tax=Psychrobacter piechaudii TaxID=1945521 RepID=A0A1R4GTB4_9GAMM|nr:fasciclin domain-containing protein [Psychrobacter piechaudii]SJM71437.1 Immunogenic protein MPT70 precursor [Psychrobacter piechaudii]